MSHQNRFKRLEEQTLKHVQTNASIYITLIGAIGQDDYATASTCLKALALRVAIGGFRNRLKTRQKEDDDKTNK